jgi:hypothetical protein
MAKDRSLAISGTGEDDAVVMPIIVPPKPNLHKSDIAAIGREIPPNTRVGTPNWMGEGTFEPLTPQNPKR